MIQNSKETPGNQEKYLFFQALAKLESAAILQLAVRLKKIIKSLNGVYFLPKEDIEELVNDAILITIKKIRSGEYEYQNYDPLTYTKVVFKNLLSNQLRKKKLKMVELENIAETDFSPEDYYLKKEKEQALAALLKKLGTACEKIIRLKYYDRYKDDEIINKNMSPYSTVDSLKSKRSQCLKKLAEIAKRNGITFF